MLLLLYPWHVCCALRELADFDYWDVKDNEGVWLRDKRNRMRCVRSPKIAVFVQALIHKHGVVSVETRSLLAVLSQYLDAKEC